MKTTYETIVLGFGNHAAIEIPPENLAELGGDKRAPVKVTVNGHTYQTTATSMDGKRLVVFPTRDRIASGVNSGHKITVTMTLEEGYREVAMPEELKRALTENNLKEAFRALSFSDRHALVNKLADTKKKASRERHIQKLIKRLT